MHIFPGDPRQCLSRMKVLAHPDKNPEEQPRAIYSRVLPHAAGRGIGGASARLATRDVVSSGSKVLVMLRPRRLLQRPAAAAAAPAARLLQTMSGTTTRRDDDDDEVRVTGAPGRSSENFNRADFQPPTPWHSRH